MYIRHSLDSTSCAQVRSAGDYTMNKQNCPKASERARSSHQSLSIRGPGACSAMVAVLAACATVTSEPVSERLDPDTATTVTTLSRPIELLSQNNRSMETDPFAYIAPFETNRMGARDLFLWVSTPQAQ